MLSAAFTGLVDSLKYLVVISDAPAKTQQRTLTDSMQAATKKKIIAFLQAKGFEAAVIHEIFSTKVTHAERLRRSSSNLAEIPLPFEDTLATYEIITFPVQIDGYKNPLDLLGLIKFWASQYEQRQQRVGIHPINKTFFRDGKNIETACFQECQWVRLDMALKHEIDDFIEEKETLTRLEQALTTKLTERCHVLNQLLDSLEKEHANRPGYVRELDILIMSIHALRKVDDVTSELQSLRVELNDTRLAQSQFETITQADENPGLLVEEKSLIKHAFSRKIEYLNMLYEKCLIQENKRQEALRKEAEEVARKAKEAEETAREAEEHRRHRDRMSGFEEVSEPAAKPHTLQYFLRTPVDLNALTFFGTTVRPVPTPATPPPSSDGPTISAAPGKRTGFE